VALNIHDLALEHLDVDVSRVRRGLMLLLILVERVSISCSVFCSLGFTIWKWSWGIVLIYCHFIALTQPGVGNAPSPAHQFVVGQSIFPA
jgi:hypothetical protein